MADKKSVFAQQRFRVTAVSLMMLICGATWAAQTIGVGSAPRHIRVLVKVRAPLAQDIEAALPLSNMTLVPGQPASARVQTFMTRHAPRKVTPMYPEIVRTKKVRGLSERQIADATRQRFAHRAQRLRTAFQPPEIGRTYVLEMDPGSRQNLQRILNDLKADPNVEFAEEEKVISVSLTPNDPYFSTSGSWGQGYEDLWGIKKVGAPTAWDTTAGAGVIVAVVDTGIDYNHPDIAANIWTNAKEIAGNGIDDDGNGYADDVRGWDFIGSDYTNPTQGNDPIDHHGHGTHVAGTIAAVGSNGIGVIGVAWQAKVMIVKGLDDSGTGLESTLANSITYAANNGADVISNSWAGQGTSQTIADAVDYAYNLGAAVVAAAGNNADDARNYFPANLPEVITVAAADHYDLIAYFSNFGSKIDVAAPGVDILSLRAADTFLGSPINDEYTRADGTSMATPHVSGVAALLLSEHPEYSNEDVRQAIRTSATDLGALGFDSSFGYGNLNASAAVSANNILESKIRTPADGTRIQGVTTLSGVARGNGFSQYTLEYGPGTFPTSWMVFQTSATPSSGTLGVFDPSGIPDGIYSLRLTAYNSLGGTFVDQIQVVVDYVSITAPPPPVVPSTATVLKPGMLLTVEGSAKGPSFHDFRLEWARGLTPTSGWASTGVNVTGGGASPVISGVLGTWDTSSINQADFYTLHILVDNSGYTSEAQTVVYLEPDLLSTNWPKWLDEVPAPGSGIVPAVNSNGDQRLLLTIPLYSNSTVPPKMRAFSADGSTDNSVSLNFGAYAQPGAADFDGNAGEEAVTPDGGLLRIVAEDNTSNVFSSGAPAQLQFSQVVLEDLDGDSQLETITYGSDFSSFSYVCVFRRDGQQLNSNFPIQITDQNNGVYFSNGPQVLVGDIDGDGKRELIVQEGTTPSSFRLLLFGNDGTPKSWSAPVLPGSPIQMVLADLDHNGKLEIVMAADTGSEALLHVLQSDGSERPGWPVLLLYRGYTQIAIGDLNVDGHEDIVVSQGPELYVFNSDGSSFSGSWPVTTDFGFGPIAIADVDGDGYPEILTSRLDSLSTSSPFLPASIGKIKPQVDRNVAAVQQNARVNVRAQDATSLQYWESKLLAFRRDSTISKSWRMLGANGRQPWFPAVITVGDFNKDGITDIAATYTIQVPVNGQNVLSEGVATVLSTGAPFHPAVNDWPMIYQNSRNTAVLIRDHTPPSVAITSPAAGASVGGTVSIAATATDNVGVSAVQFQVDGVNLGFADTTAPFSVLWDTSAVPVGNHTLGAVASDAAGNLRTSAPITVTVGVPAAGFSKAALAFGSQRVNVSSPGKSVTLTSTGTATLSISGFSVTGDFSQTNNCGNSLLPGQSCTVNVVFTPSARGARNGTVTLNSNATGLAPKVTLSGTGVGPVASVSPSSLSFAAQAVNTSSSPKTLVLSNTGDATLHIAAISASGDFTRSNSCGASLGAGAQCSIYVIFKPSVFGIRTGALSITDDAVGGSTQTAALSGTGLDYQLSASPSGITVAAGKSAAYTVIAQALGGTFASSISLSCSGLPAASSCSFSPASVRPGSTSAASHLTISTTVRHSHNGTPAGTYAVTIKGISSTQHSTTVMLTVN